jgi:hypothetical protein
MTTPRSVNQLSQEKLENLTTQRLIAYLRKLQQCEESMDVSDWQEKEVASSVGIVFKSTKEWQSQYSLVKVELAKRPNIK